MDFEIDAQVQISDEKLKRLSTLANTQLLIEQEISKTEFKLEDLKKKQEEVSQKLIPELMNEIGMAEFTLKSGAKVKVKKFYSGNLGEKNPRAKEGMQWLTEHGFSALIKKEFILDLGRNPSIDYDVIRTIINKAFKDNSNLEFKTEVKEGVHHKTLTGFMKEQIEAGNELPLELFKGFIGDKTEIIL